MNSSKYVDLGRLAALGGNIQRSSQSLRYPNRTVGTLVRAHRPRKRRASPGCRSIRYRVTSIAFGTFAIQEGRAVGVAGYTSAKRGRLGDDGADLPIDVSGVSGQTVRGRCGSSGSRSTRTSSGQRDPSDRGRCRTHFAVRETGEGVAAPSSSARSVRSVRPRRPRRSGLCWSSRRRRRALRRRPRRRVRRRGAGRSPRSRRSDRGGPETRRD